MSDQLLLVLKLCLLALLYLFFFRVVRAVWAELRTPSPVAAGAGGAAPRAPSGRRARKAEARAARARPQLVVVEPVTLAGRSYALEGEATIGRAAGCQITLDDTYASQIHARVFPRDEHWLVEDLGSTNGTWLNRQKVSGPMVLQRGDRLQIGNTVVELR